MKLSVRRIGNSLGVILPKSTLTAWGVGEGDDLELTERALRPPSRGHSSHERLDELRRSVALAVIESFSTRAIRAQILANLHRWKQHDSYVSAFDEWRRIAETEDDGALFAAMLGRDQEAVRLRQSAPFVGLLPQEQVRRLHEEAAG